MLATLSPETWKALETLATHPADAHLLRRVQPLLWEVSARLQATRQLVCKWVVHFRTSSTLTWLPTSRQASAAVVPAWCMGSLIHSSWQ